MGLKDSLSNFMNKGKGKAQESAGRATGDREQEAKGQATQTEAGMKQAGENLKNGDVKGAREEAKDAFDE